jgi:hypothetical protein
MRTSPPDYHQEWMTHTVHVHGFPSLSSEQEEFVDSPEFMLVGNQWRLKIYPGGDYDAAEGMVSLYLANKSDKSIEVDYALSVNDGNGKQVAYERSDGPQHFGTDTSSWNFTNFAERSTLLSSLVNGVLVIEVRIKLATPTKSVPTPFIPENPVAKMIHGLFLDKKSADIVFEVGGDKGNDNNAFPAHRLIIENCSSVFADLCESHDDSTTPIIQINDVTPDIFRLLLSYIYGGKISNDDTKLHAKEIIDAADKYGVVNLKLKAEASLVEDTTFTIQNVMEHILYADSKNLALLKEAAMDYIVDNKTQVIEKLSFANAPGTLVTDVLAATARGEMRSGGGDVTVDNQYNALRISELRKRAYENGLNVDGSREMLIAALEAVQILNQKSA